MEEIEAAATETGAPAGTTADSSLASRGAQDSSSPQPQGLQSPPLPSNAPPQQSRPPQRAQLQSVPPPPQPQQRPQQQLQQPQQQQRQQPPSTIRDWLERLKPGFADDYGGAFEEFGITQQEEIKDINDPYAWVRV